MPSQTPRRLPAELVFTIVGLAFGEYYRELVHAPLLLPADWEPGQAFMHTSHTFRECAKRFLRPLWGKKLASGAKCSYRKTMALLVRLARHVHGDLDTLVANDQPKWLKEPPLRAPAAPLVLVLKGVFCYAARARIWPSKAHWDRWEAHVSPMVEHAGVMVRMAECYAGLPPGIRALALGPLEDYMRGTVAPWTVSFTRAYILRHLVDTLISQFIKDTDLPQDVFILAVVDALDAKSLEHSKQLAEEVKTSCDTDMRALVSAFGLSPACAEPNVVTDPAWRFPSEDWKVVSESLHIWRSLPVDEAKVDAGRELWRTLCMLMSPADRKFLRIPGA